MSAGAGLQRMQALLVAGIHPGTDAHRLVEASGLIEQSEALPSARRFAIYRQNITSTRVRALEAIHPVCRRVLGSACFGALAREFAWRSPDDSPDLNRYGAGFADYLGGLAARRPAFAALPYLGELASLEASLHACYYASDTPLTDFAGLRQAAVADGHVRVVDGLVVHAMRHPVFEIWRRHQAGEAPAQLPALTAIEHLCVYRQDQVPTVERIDGAEYRLLYAARAPVRLSILAGQEALAGDLALLLPRLLARGWLQLA